MTENEITYAVRGAVLLSTYLKLTGKKIGLLINFNASTMTGGAIIREANLL